MRAALLSMVLLVAGATAADAQRAADPGCRGRDNVLGVSRTVVVDTTDGPRYGHQQYKDISFLNDGEVVLTFDDGPLRPHTQPVLDALASHCTKATFFMVGRMALADPEMVREIARRGHTIGTHTWSHANLRKGDAQREIELGFSAVRLAAGQPIAPFFRFPFLADSARNIAYVQSRQIGIFSIDIDAVDYRAQQPEQVRQTILSELATNRKGILLFHDIQPSTAGALAGLLDELKARKFKVVHFVPREAARTVAEFDQVANRELQRRKVATATQPLANRSVTWPLAPPPESAQAPSPNLQRPSSARAPAPPVVIEELPPPRAFPAPAPLPAPNPARAPRPSREYDDWRNKVFGQ